MYGMRVRAGKVTRLPYVSHLTSPLTWVPVARYTNIRDYYLQSNETWRSPKSTKHGLFGVTRPRACYPEEGKQHSCRAGQDVRDPWVVPRERKHLVKEKRWGFIETGRWRRAGESWCHGSIFFFSFLIKILFLPAPCICSVRGWNILLNQIKKICIFNLEALFSTPSEKLSILPIFKCFLR